MHLQCCKFQLFKEFNEISQKIESKENENL
jgi:hypothetical protein